MHGIQEKILTLAKAHDISQYGYRKLGEKIGVAHPQQVKWHLNKLLKDGHLYRTGSGSIRPVQRGGNTALYKIPVLGMANCGEPLSHADDTQLDNLTVSRSLVDKKSRQNLFAVVAVGDSMNKCKVNGRHAINDGDYVIVDSSVEVPNSGDYVVSSIEGLANIKRFEKDDINRTVALVSESSRLHPPIVIDENELDSYRVHGKVVAVVPSYR